VVEREIAGLAEAHDAQGGAHRALAGREHHAGDEHQHVLPNRAVKKLRKGAISAMTIGGSIGARRDEEKERCRVIAKVRIESP